MCSDGDEWGRFKPKRAPYRSKPVLPWNKRLYRRLGQMFLRWAETDGRKW